MARPLCYSWILHCTCCLLVYSHLILEEKKSDEQQSLSTDEHSGISMIELRKDKIRNIRRENNKQIANRNRNTQNNRISMGHRVKRPKAHGQCVKLWGICLPPSPPCCNPCSFCYCRFFNTVCFCRKLNPKCLDRT